MLRPISDQCAIRLGAALSATGVSLTSFRGARCWNHAGEKHILRAEELGTWIGANRFAGRGDARPSDVATFQDSVNGKTGIRFCKDFRRQGSETVANRSGDHIDLWNGNLLGGA